MEMASFAFEMVYSVSIHVYSIDVNDMNLNLKISKASLGGKHVFFASSSDSWPSTKTQ